MTNDTSSSGALPSMIMNEFPNPKILHFGIKYMIRDGIAPDANVPFCHQDPFTIVFVLTYAIKETF